MNRSNVRETESTKIYTKKHYQDAWNKSNTQNAAVWQII